MNFMERVWDKYSDPRLWNSIKHPLTFTILLCVGAILYASGMDVVLTLINKILLAGDEAAAMHGIDRNMTNVLGSTLVVVGFSVGVIGALVSFLSLMRCSTRKVQNFTAISELAEEEHYALTQWIGNSDTTARNLAALWGEREGEDG